MSYSERATRHSSRLQEQSAQNCKNRSCRKNTRKPESKYIFSDSEDERLPPAGTPQKLKSKIKETTPKKEHREVVPPEASGKTTRRSERKYIFSDSEDENERLPPSTPKKSKSKLTPEITPKKEHRRRKPSEITPQKKQNTAIPVTPNNKSDIVHNPVTPSTLLKRLSLVTPTKRKYEGGSSKLADSSEDEKQNVSPSKQSKVENDENALSSSKSKNEKAVSPKKSSSGVYQSARRALHSTFPVEMPGREAELESIRDFIHDHLRNDTSGTLYVSGPPGTGKTASLNLVLQENAIATKVIHVYVNCTSIKSSGSVYSRIAKDLKIDLRGAKTEKDFISAITTYLDRKHKTVLLVLDEIDQLESKKQSILYTIFEWPAKKNSRLILIGIANALDLTDRILPRLQARCELKPKLMHFSPYTKQQIVDIFTSRLKSAGVLDVFSPVALQMLAAKVSAVSGDLRRALDIGRRVVELVDVDSKDPLKPLENLADELDQKLKSVDVKQVVSALNNVYGTSHNFADEMDEALPLQQKIVLCALILILKRAKNKDVTIGRLHEVYRKVCNKRNLQVIDQGEFMGMCSLIETKGIIKMIRKKDPRMTKVGLEWNEDEIAAVLNDKQLMSTIVQDVSCLGKM